MPSAAGLAAYRECLQSLSGEPINFVVSKHQEDGQVFLTAKSVNFAGGAIMTSGKTLEELNQNIKDAIFTAFGVPARYCDYHALKSDLPVAELQLRYAVS